MRKKRERARAEEVGDGAGGKTRRGKAERRRADMLHTRRTGSVTERTSTNTKGYAGKRINYIPRQYGRAGEMEIGRYKCVRNVTSNNGIRCR